MKGQFSDASPLSANAAPAALASADLVILVGQHCMPTVGEFAFGPDAKYIRIDQQHEDIGRNVPIDLGIVSCELAALEALADLTPQMRHEVVGGRDRGGAEALRRSEPRVLQDRSDLYRCHPSRRHRERAWRFPLSRQGCRKNRRRSRLAATASRATCGASCVAIRPGQIMNGAYQYGAIGPDVGYAVGVAAAACRHGAGVQAAYKGHPIICITGDAGFGYTAMEIDTMAKYRLPVVVIVYNNNAWGTWVQAAEQPLALADSPVPGESALRQAGGGARWARRVRDRAVAVQARARAGVRHRRERAASGRDQLPGQEGILEPAEVPPGALGKIEPGCMSYYH